MKNLISAVFSAVLMSCLLATGPAVAHDEHNPGEKKIFTKHFQGTLFDITEHAAFSAEVFLDDKEYKIGKGVIGIALHDEKDSDIAGAKIIITLRNIETGETAPGTVTVKDNGNGLYIVSGLNLQRKGRWELALTIKKDNVEDSVKFILPDAAKDLHPKGRYSP